MNILVFIFGTIVGSFLNVVINRYGKESIAGRSYCPSCHHTLSAFELIPLLSFIFLRGKCRTCKTPISFQYPIVELLTSTLFSLSFIKFGFSLEFLFSLLIGSLLVIIAVYDFKHTIIPDEIVFAFIVLSFFRLIVMYGLKELFGGEGNTYLLAGALEGRD